MTNEDKVFSVAIGWCWVRLKQVNHTIVSDTRLASGLSDSVIVWRD